MAAAVTAFDPRRARLIEAVDAMKALCVGEMQMGISDCPFVVADALRAVIGVDPAARFRGEYRNKVEAYRHMRELGYRSVAEAIMGEAARLGWPEIDPGDAQPGDGGIITIKTLTSCALRHRSGFWIARKQGGYMALAAVSRAFRISLIGSADIGHGSR